MPKSVTVSTLAELKSTLAAAKGGETILLESGNYDKLVLSSIDFPANVTIASADPGNPAVFSGLTLTKVGNLIFDGVVFDYTYQPGQSYSTAPFDLRSSHDVTIRNSVFDGDLTYGTGTFDDGYGNGYGLGVRSSQNITIENNEFFDFGRGIVLSKSSDLTVSGNDLHRMSSDGMDFAQVQNVLIEGNFLHDFLRSPESTAHPDMIQFFSTGAEVPSGNITIRGNRLDIGEGDGTQSIFMRNERVDVGGGGKDMYYYNILIEDNVIANAHIHGITVGETNGLTIRNNTLVHAGSDPGAAIKGVHIPAIRVVEKATGVTVTDNITSAVNGHDGQSGWTVKGNLLLSPKDYVDNFVTSTIHTNEGIHEFRARPGGVIDKTGVGAAETGDTRPASLTAQFDITLADQSLSTWTFDATSSVAGKGGFPEGTVFLWDFGDGTTASGRIVQHSYADDGYHDARLTIQLPDGRTDGARQQVAAETEDVLKMVRGTGFTIYDPGTTATLALSAVAKQGLAIGASGTVASIDRQHVAELVGADSFGVDLSLKASSLASAGEVFRLHGSIIASVTSKGELSLQLTTTAGLVKLATTGAGLSDKALHDIRIESGDGQVSISVDGKVLASAEVSAPLAGGGQPLSFGNPWGNANFAGVITDFAIDHGKLALPDASKTVVLDAAWATDGTIAPPLEKPVDPDASAPEVTPPAVPEEPDSPPTTHPIRLDLGDAGVAHRIERPDVVAMLENDAFTVTFGLQADSPASEGEVFRIHQSIITSVDASGEFRVQAFTSDGQIRLSTKGAQLGDLEPHEVGVSLADGVLSIIVDGTIKASTVMTGTLLNEGAHDLTFGNPWGKQNFDGALTDFDLQLTTLDGAGREARTSASLSASAEVVDMDDLFSAADTDGGFYQQSIPGLDGNTAMDMATLIATDRFGFLSESGAHIPHI